MTATATSESARPLTGDEVKPLRFARIAEKIQADPSLLDIPLRNIERWLARGDPDFVELGQWRTLLLTARDHPDGMMHLLQLLRDQSADAVYLKEYSPFPGVLTESDLQNLQWISSH